MTRRMELAYHIRDHSQVEQVSRWETRWRSLYPPEESDGLPPWKGPVTRIYVGDEFCIHRLPQSEELNRMMAAADARGMSVTLLTPPVAMAGLLRIGQLLDGLRDCPDGFEIVANDWGVARFLRERGASVVVSLGRLLNKGFKDPRLAETGPERPSSVEVRTLLNQGTFDHPRFLDLVSDLGIRRLERDLFPYADACFVCSGGYPHEGGHGGPPVPASVYFPFGYVTTGRVCWSAMFQPRPPHFLPPEICKRPCGSRAFELKGPDLRFRLFQNGNTVYYLYSPAQYRLLEAAPLCRWVFQDMIS